VASKIIVIVRTSHVKCSSSSILIAIERKQRCSARSFFRKVRTRIVGLGRTGVVFEFDSLSSGESVHLEQDRLPNLAKVGVYSSLPSLYPKLTNNASASGFRRSITT